MKWTIDQEPKGGIMFRGQSTVRVKNRNGQIGVAKVEYSPAVRVVGPVVEDVGRDDWGLPIREPEVIDSQPTFS